ncbi:MAG: hypothetical protein JWM95_3950 [Gemmatimonadetes bacterium]|nr:hypothetical protein [Gemmatimonadota bacterium]
MRIQDVFIALNQMEADDVVDRYAIGGAVGATFYLEPVATLDVDVFVAFRSAPGSLLVSPQPIFDYLRERGATMEGEYVMIGGWPVQFLPSTGALVDEALEQAVEVDVEGATARVFTAEHLAAIALQTGRAKDKARLLQFIESGVLADERFKDIVSRQDLNGAWERFERQFLSDNS